MLKVPHRPANGTAASTKAVILVSYQAIQMLADDHFKLTAPRLAALQEEHVFDHSPWMFRK